MIELMKYEVFTEYYLGYNTGLELGGEGNYLGPVIAV